MAWKGFDAIPVSYDNAHRHYEPQKYRVTGRITATGLSDSTYYYFYVDKFSTGTVAARSGRNIDITYSSDFAYKSLSAYFAPSETYPDVTFSNPSASVTQWGSKVTATASLSKTSGFIDPNNPEEISAIVTSNTFRQFVPYTVNGGTFYYKKSTDGAYTSFAFSGTSIDLTGRLVGNETYSMYVVETLDDATTVTSPVYTFSTEDAIPTVTAVSPANIITYGSVDFSWIYSTTTGTLQHAFDIEISDDNSTWTSLANHIVSSSTSYSATVTGAGTKYWRVRGYNQDDVAGSWDVASFVNYVAPDVPTDVNVSGTGRITVSWSTPEQIAFQVKVGQIDSGWIYSTDRFYFINEYLPDGEYEVMVRITNSLGLSSDWAAFTFQQSMGVTPPVATVTMREGYNEIVAEMGTFDHFYVLRNGIVIGKTDSGMMLDYNCNGEDEYIIRGVMADDSFADLQLIGNYICRKPALITPLGDILYVNERLDEEPSISSSKSLDVVSVQYLGRTKPVHHKGTMRLRSWSVTCSKDIEVGQVYFYRNFRGDKAWVICSNVQSALNSLGVHEYNYTLEETDYSEGIAYEV